MKRKIIIFVLCLSCIISLSVGSFAATTKTYTILDFTIDMFTVEANQGGAVTYYNQYKYFDTVTRNGITYNRVRNGCLENGSFVYNSNYYTSGQTKNLLAIKFNNFSLKDEYNLKFSVYLNSSRSFNTEIFLADDQNNKLATIQYLYSSNGSEVFCDVNFVLSQLGVSSNNNIYLCIESQLGSVNASGFAWQFSPIELTNLDDNTGLFNSILEWLQNIRNNIVDGFGNTVSSVSTGFSNLTSSLSTFFSNLSTSISNGLTAVKNGINDKLESVKTAINNKIDSIQTWFINLGDRINEFFEKLKNYLLYFRHPVTLVNGVPVDSNGNSIYTNPFSSKLNNVKSTVDGWIDSINDFIETIDESADNVSQHLSVFKNVINRFFAAGNTGPALMLGIVVFGVVFVIIRKIIGR